MRAISPRFAVRLSLALLAVALVAGAAGAVLLGLTWSTASGEDLSAPQTAAVNLIGALAVSVLGAIIAAKRPENLLGWLFLAGGVFSSLGTAGERYVVYALITEPGSLPVPSLAASALADAWLLVIPQIVLLLVLFPSGQVTALRWRRLAIASVLVAIAGYVCLTLQPGNLDPPFDAIENSLGVAALDGIEAVGVGCVVVLFAMTIAATVHLIGRFLRSQGDEREQFKWFVYAAAFIPIIFTAHIIAEAVEPRAIDLIEVLFGLIFILLPVAVGVAVLKYRLYEIDLLINRTLVYVPLTAIVIGLYTALVGVLKTIATEVTGTDTDAAVAVTTLLVVVVLTPLKNQLQVLVDRYFKDQHDALRGLRTLTTQAQGVVRVLEAERFAQEFLDEAVAALDAQGGAIEFTLGGERRAVTTEAPPVSVALTMPLHHDGTRIGELRLGPPGRGGSYDDAATRSLNESASVLAEVIGLASRARLPDVAVSSVDGASIELEPAATEPR